MGNPVAIAFVSADQFAFGALLVVEIVLDEQVVAADLLDDRGRLADSVEIEARNVEAVDRLDQQADAVLAEFRRRELQIGDERGAQHAVRHAIGCYADETVDLFAVERRRIVDSRCYPLAEFVDPVRQDGDAALAARPVAGRQVVKYLRQAVALEGGAERHLLELIGKEIFHAFETGLRGKSKAVEERRLVEQHGQVCRKSRHAVTPLGKVKQEAGGKTLFPSRAL